MRIDMLGKNRARERVDEWLSAYIDGALSPRERARLEARLAQDAALRARLESLQRTVALVRGMPPVRAPRNFLLTPAMVRQTAPVARRLAPALTFATAISGLLCVILLVGNLIAAGPSRLGAAAPAPMAAYEETPQMLETGPTEAKKAPPASETALPEEGLLSRAATATEPPAPEMRAWSEGTPSPIEAAPFPPDMGGVGGGAAPGPPPGEPPEPGEEVLPTPTPEMTPSEMARVAIAEGTPPAITVAEPTPVPVPPEMPGGKPPLPPTSWLPVGGLALLTAVLAIFSLRAWRAR
jgi:anti-sigma factor RsiW